ncbi:hypothetical protein TKK_0011317 [Trichogramma kaykai]
MLTSAWLFELEHDPAATHDPPFAAFSTDELGFPSFDNDHLYWQTSAVPPVISSGAATAPATGNNINGKAKPRKRLDKTSALPKKPRARKLRNTDKNYFCSHCSKPFSRLDSLRRHERKFCKYEIMQKKKEIDANDGMNVKED